MRACIFAAGDDVLALMEHPKLNLSLYRVALSDQLTGRHGLGVPMRDVKIGYLHEMDFLSKNLVARGRKVEVYRKLEKLEFSGTCTSSLSSKLTRAQYCAMQCLQLADVPERVSAAYKRFAIYASTVLKPKLL